MIERYLDTDIEAPDAYAILVAVLLMDFGRTIWAVSAPGSTIVPLLTFYVWGTAIALVVVGVSTVDLREYGLVIATATTVAIFAVVVVALVSLYGSEISTDVGQFLHEATLLTLSGENPYNANLAGVESYPTPTMSGGTVTRYSYPAGAIVSMLPQYAVGLTSVRLTPLLFSFGVGAVMLRAADNEFALLVPAVLLSGDLVTWPLLGLVDALWILPLCLACYWWTSYLRLSAVAYGFAASVEQIPWFIGPFLLLWLVRDHGRDMAAQWLVLSLITFGAVNLPFVLWGPDAWLTGALQPLFGTGSPPVHQGAGLASLTVFGIFPIAKWAQTALVAVVAVIALAVYYRRPSLRWGAWISWMPLLLFHYRSFPTYFVAGLPLMAVAFFERRRLDAA